MSTHNLCFEQKYEKISEFLSENFQFLVVKFSIYMYLNRHVFVMYCYRNQVVYTSSSIHTKSLNGQGEYCFQLVHHSLLFNGSTCIGHLCSNYAQKPSHHGIP